jgi:glutathione peroxidase
MQGGIIMIYDYKITTGKGQELDLADYKGKVILIVNTATGCGFTPQYAPIEQLYKDYHDAGLEILDVPCNQFGGQAQGSDDEIHEFCTMHFNTTFPQMKKADVNGENELPLFTYLKAQKGFEGFGKGAKALAMSVMLKKIDKNYKENPDIKWNFTKFVVDRDGNVVARFEPTADMSEVEACVKSLL